MIYYSDNDPRIMPHQGCGCGQVDRLQDASISNSLNRTKLNEIGRAGVVAYQKDAPSVSVSLRQFEYGANDFFRILSNNAVGTTKVEFSDFESSVADLAFYRTDSSGTFLGTAWYPDLRTSSISLSIGDPDAIIERNINLVGEDDYILQGDNKYLIFLRDDNASGASHTIVIGSGDYSTYPDPVVNPESSGTYILKVTRSRSSVITELTLTTDYTYNSGTKTITIPGSENGDVYHVWYSAATYISGDTPFTANDTDMSHIEAESAVIYLQTTSDRIYRLQSVNVDIAFDRYDLKEIGNNKTVLRGVRDTNITATLGRTLEDYAIEDYLRGATRANDIISSRNYLSNISLIIKIFTDSTHSTFKIGYKFTDMTPSTIDDSDSVQDYVNRSVSMICEEGHVSTDEGDF